MFNIRYQQINVRKYGPDCFLWELLLNLQKKSFSLKQFGLLQVSDTHALVAAVAMGKGVKPLVPQNQQPGGPGGMMVAPGGQPGGPMGPNQPGMGPMGKAPSSIKTNIKAANQIHPYGR